MKIPRSTYRLQLRESFDLAAATEALDYLRALGVDWVYLSPLLQAAAGSEHGYDVVDPSRVDEARGGGAALEAFAERAHRLGMGVLVDIVPNHMGVGAPAANRWWWDVLKHGPASRYAQAFDIDWEFGGGRVRLPVLADGPDDLAALEIVGQELHYRRQRFPLAPGSAADGADPRVVHSRQHYELIDPHRSGCDLNYRRFFAVSSLAALRVEVPWVFRESHAEVLRWVREGHVDGLRVDHPDGLADPAGYLDRLAAASGGAYVLVEKILETGERLPTWWATAGTTGYDALAEFDRILVDPAGRAGLDRLDARLRDSASAPSWEQLRRDAKREVARGMLRPEVSRLARDVGRGGGPTGPPVVEALTELLAAFPVYRSYLPAGAEYLRTAIATVRTERPMLSEVLDRLSEVLSDPRNPAAIRFQQTSGMVMAKGVEDRAYYRYSRLGSLTEVGGDPSEFSIDPAEFHRRQTERQAGYPAALTALSTHDTKRGEDVRARISVLAEIPDAWSAALARLRELAPLQDGPLECLVWQAILGTWPASRERLHAYAEKAAREAGNSTSWDRPDQRFEQRLHALVDAAFDNPAVAEILADLVERVRMPGWSNSLSAKLLQLTAPGVPDVYQGTELWEDSLVDPDNRRAVDFPLRARELARLAGDRLPEPDGSGAVKLLVTSRALRLRRDRPDLFHRYAAVTAFGPAASHLIAFDRGGAVTLATRLPLGLASGGGWHDTGIRLPRLGWVDVLTGHRFSGGEVRLSEVLTRYPVALLAREPPDPRQLQVRGEPT